MTRLRALFAATLLCAAAGASQTQAQSPAWPHRPVKIIAPFAAGGAADTLGRIIAEQLSTAFHQQFFIENRGGAGGIVGALAGAQAEPDGYTLVISSIASNVISPVFNANSGYDGLRDFTHIAYLGGPPVVMAVHPSLGVSTYKDFLSLARARKEPLNFISPGTGSHGFLVGEYLAREEGYKVSHIPYKGFCILHAAPSRSMRLI
jgi:tripartite-type tricarboxylate transporter receptor subunit TctC